MTSPALSVIVTIVEGGAALVRCLEALAAQDGAGSLDVIVPYDSTVAIDDLSSRFPQFRFLPLGALIMEAAPTSAFIQHKLFDRRRAAGLHAATGRLIAIIEDRGAPRADWAAAMIAEHVAHDAAAIGGVVIDKTEGLFERALYLCDFHRYAPPVEEGEVEYVTDINIAYKREALMALEPLWADGYEEATVNWALRDAGQGVRLSMGPAVLYRRGRTVFAEALAERLHWGRIFGIMRARRWSMPAALGAAAAAVAMPLVLLMRHVRMRAAKGAPLGETLAVLPAMALLLVCWSVGEALGYLEGVFRVQEGVPVGEPLEVLAEGQADPMPSAVRTPAR